MRLSVLELRYEDQEKYTLMAIRNKVLFKIETSPYTVNTFGRTSHKIYLAMTVAKGPSTAREQFMKARSDWVTKDDSAKNI
ncbi:hypothetical protein PG985_007818 [Apiospora marii]|uniref:Uncharacterized protein n=1 Tax=Apiospora marii TaxID=335849 RepID=A0ABR1SQ02_9PEZI